MATNFVLSMQFYNDGKNVLTKNVIAPSSFPVPTVGEVFVLHHTDKLGSVRNYEGKVVGLKVDITTNDATGNTSVLQLLRLEGSKST